MNLSTLLGQSHNTASLGSGSVNGTGSVSGASHHTSGVSIQAGQTIQGEVVSVKGNDIVLHLENGSQVNARLDQGIQVTAGQAMTFEVKNYNGARLALTPLYENLSKDPNVLKALTAAGMPATADNVNLVSVLMREGLPVDKNTLQSFGRQMMLTPSADPVTLAQMNRLQIPATPENIAQFEAYKNYEHQISQSVLEIADGLTETFSQMTAGNDIEGAVNLYKEVLMFLAEKGADAEQLSSSQPSQPGLSGQPGIPGEPPPAAVLLGDAPPGETQPAAIHHNLPGQAETVVAPGNNASTSGTVVQTDLSGILLDDLQGSPLTAAPNLAPAHPAASGPDILNLAADIAEGGLPQTSDSMPGLLATAMSPESRLQLAGLMQEAGFSEQLTSQVSSGSITQSALLQTIAQELGNLPPDRDTKLADVFGSKQYTTILKNEIGRQWLLEPEEVAGDRQVEELYRRLNEHTNKLANALSQSSRADTPLANNVTNLSNNLNFMNQLNQLFTYVQLPLKMNGDSTHGELFVYTNKKNLAKKDGNVSALLHLDMEYLGPVDVYVAMQNQNVSTKFYLSDDSVIDLIAENIHVLNERLNSRGYSMSCEFVAKEGEKTAMEEMLAANKNVSVLASYSFDARA